MKKSFITAVLLAATSVAGFSQSVMRTISNYSKAKESGKGLKFYQSSHMAVGFILANEGTLNWDYFNRDSDNSYTGLGNINRTFKNSGTTINASVYFPVFNITETSVLAINAGAYGYFLKAEDLGPMQVGVTRYTSTLTSTNLGLPIALDYKYGGEAINDKAERFSFTIGAGLCPMFMGTIFTGESSTKGTVRPYVHGEIGFFAGIEWKFKVDYLGGSPTYFHADYRDLGREGMPEGSIITITGKPVLSVGIALMPFSFDWESSRW